MRRAARGSWLVAVAALASEIVLAGLGRLSELVGAAVIAAGWTLGFIFSEQSQRAEAMSHWVDEEGGGDPA